MPILKWTPEKVTDAAMKIAEQRMGKAAALVTADVKKKMNKHGGGRPSAPGQPPHKQSGRLFQSIDFVVRREKDEVVGVIFSSDPKARRLELGFQGVDSRGRRYSQAPRPAFRPALAENKERVAKLLRQG